MLNISGYRQAKVVWNTIKPETDPGKVSSSASRNQTKELTSTSVDPAPQIP